MDKRLRWTALPLAAAALVGTALLPTASSAASASSATTATAKKYVIKLITLTCKKKQDSDKDEPELRINGDKVFSAEKVRKNQEINLRGTNFKFSNNATIELFELDKSSNDDFLGSVLVTKDQAGTGVRTAWFDHRNRAEYTLEYRVSKA
jgi:hypothetical protein